MNINSKTMTNHHIVDPNKNLSLKIPRISVIIPAYNNSRYICRAIESVLSQTRTSFEIIVIDDGSTDDTRSALNAYMNKIRYIFQQNKGVSSARNHGLGIANGEFVVFLDSDDYFLPEKLANQVAVFEAMPALGMVHSGWYLVNENEEKIKKIEPWHNTPELNIEAWLTWKPVLPGAMMFRRTYLNRVGGFDTRLRQAEDVDLVLRLALAGCQAVWLRKPTVCYRLHGSNTTQNGLQQVKDLDLVINHFFAHPKVPAKIRPLEGKVRYYTLIWSVWKLYLTGYKTHITPYLRYSLKWSKYYPTIKFIALEWAVKISEYCAGDGHNLEEIHQFLPYFKDAAHLDNDLWLETENAINWWSDVWRHVLNQDRFQSTLGLSGYQNLTIDEIIHRATPVIFVCTDTTVGHVSQFWKDAKEKGLIPNREQYKVIILYLSLFSEAVFGSRWRKAITGLLYAGRAGFHPGAWGIWFRFMVKALHHIMTILTKSVSRMLASLTRK